jgi:two-component system sensor histidine kinase KdpD
MDALVKGALVTMDMDPRRLAVDVARDLPSFVSDPSLVERAIVVIVENALRFSPVERPVRISAGATGDTVELLVIDQGSGLTAAKRLAMLESHRGLEEDDKGCALAFSVASGFVETLGGHVRFEDTPGGGLTVVLAFPRGADGADQSTER